MRNHVKTVSCFVAVLCIVNIVAIVVFARSDGPPDRHSGSPADNYETCNHFGTGCHNSYEVNTGTATFSISAPGSYTAGETLSVTVFFNNSTTAKHGFEVSVLGSSNVSAGTFNTVDGKTQTSNSDEINYIKHTSEGSSQSGNASWTFEWVAPSSDTLGTVTFYASGNEADGDGSFQNDYIYTTNLSISQVVETATPTAAATATPAETPTPVSDEDKKGSISGKIIDEDGDPVASARIKLKGRKSGVKKKTTSDNDGMFEFADLDAGKYRITVTKKGYKKFHQRIEVQEGEASEVEIEMEEKNLQD